MYFLTIFVISIIYFIIKYMNERRAILKYSTKFAGPKPIPIFGNTLLFPSDPNEVFNVLMEMPKVYGKNVVSYGLLNDLGIMITELKDIEKLLSNSGPTKKSTEYFFLEPWLGTGLLMSSGKKWFQRRKIITPAFHFNILEQFIDVFNKQTNIFIDKIKPYANKNIDFDVYHYTTLLALDVICEASMGISLGAQDKPHLEYVKSVKEMSILFYKRIFSLSKQFLWLYDYTADGKKQPKLLKHLHKFTDDVICARRKTLLDESIYTNNKNNKISAKDGATTNTASTADDYNYERKKMTFLDILLNATVDGQPLTNMDIREEVDTFMFEGHDTTTSGIAFALYCISQNQDVQMRLYDEIINVIGMDKTNAITYNQLQELKYLDMVIKESLRLYPPVPIMGRCLTEPTQIGEATLPTGQNIAIPVYALHRDSDLYENPEKFNPERFTLEEQQKRHPFAYIPFSAGSRNCIGQRFALLEIKSTVTKILQHYKLLPCDLDKPLKLQADLVLKSTTGVYCKIETRK